MTPDVNVLVAASRSDHPHHRVARAWLEQALATAQSGGTLTLMPIPDGQVKLLHFWPVKLLQAGRADYEASAVRAMRAAASLRR